MENRDDEVPALDESAARDLDRWNNHKKAIDLNERPACPICGGMWKHAEWCKYNDD